MQSFPSSLSRRVVPFHCFSETKWQLLWRNWNIISKLYVRLEPKDMQHKVSCNLEACFMYLFFHSWSLYQILAMPAIVQFRDIEKSCMNWAPFPFNCDCCPCKILECNNSFHLLLSWHAEKGFHLFLQNFRCPVLFGMEVPLNLVETHTLPSSISTSIY